MSSEAVPPVATPPGDPDAELTAAVLADLDGADDRLIAFARSYARRIGIDQVERPTPAVLSAQIRSLFAFVDGLSTWGDGRLFILGTEGYIELRKYVNVATDMKGGNHLYIVDKQQARYIDCNKVALPFGPQFVSDIVNRTEVAQDQAQALLAAELVLTAQKNASRPVLA